MNNGRQVRSPIADRASIMHTRLRTTLDRFLRPDRVLRRLLRTVLWHPQALDDRSVFADAGADVAGGEDDAVRWVRSVDVLGSVKPALVMRPGASRTFVVRVPPRGAVRCSLALLSETRGTKPGKVECRMSATPIGGGRAIRRRWMIDGNRQRDHAWRTVMINLSPLSGRQVAVELATSVPGEAYVKGVRVIWGQPELLRGRSLLPLLRRQLRSVRIHGAGATLRRYRALLTGALINGSEYEAWLRLHGYRSLDLARLREASARLTHRPKVSLLTPVCNGDLRLLRECVDSVRAQAYPGWELCLADDGSSDSDILAWLRDLAQSDRRIRLDRLSGPRGAAAAAQRALSTGTGEFVGLLAPQDQLAPDALYRMVEALNEHPDADLLYSDEDTLEADGSWTEPYFKPGWSPDHLRSTMYIGDLALYRRDVVDAAGGFRSELDGAHAYDLALRVTERTERVVRVPRILYHRRRRAVCPSSWPGATRRPDAASQALGDHLARLGVNAQVEPRPHDRCWRVRYRIVGEPLVSIIIPTAGRIVQTADGPRDVLLSCLRSLSERTAYKRFELLIVDDGYLSDVVESYLASIPHRRISHSHVGPFNFSAKVNFAARHALGEHLLLLNDDTEVIGAEWLSAMLELSQQPAVGAVGAKLYYPDGRLQHVGVVLGFGGGADHVFRGQPGHHPGYFGSTKMIRNYSAVTAACLMTRRAIYDEMGGFDPVLATDFNDVDYCLRLGTRGYRVVFTPFAALYHFEGGSFGSRSGKVNPREIRALNRRWASVIEDDPFYNPNLSRASLDYDLRMW